MILCGAAIYFESIVLFGVEWQEWWPGDHLWGSQLVFEGYFVVCWKAEERALVFHFVTFDGTLHSEAFGIS